MSPDKQKKGESSDLNSNSAGNNVSLADQQSESGHADSAMNIGDRPEIATHLANAQNAEASGDLAKALEQYCFVLAFAALPKPTKTDSKRAIRALIKAYAFSSLEKLAVFREVISTIAPSSALVTLVDETLNRYTLSLPEEIEDTWGMADLVDRLELPGVISGWRIAWHIDTVLKETSADGSTPSVSAYSAMRSTTVGVIEEDQKDTEAVQPKDESIDENTSSISELPAILLQESVEERIDLANDINRNAGAIIAPNGNSAVLGNIILNGADSIPKSLPDESLWGAHKSNGTQANTAEASLVSGYISAAELYLRMNKKDLAKPFIEDGLELEADNPTLLKLYRELGD